MFNSFKNKVQQFWLAFAEEEATIREMIDNKVEGKVLLNFTESILKIVFKDAQFQLGVNIDNKYELILTPQGDRIKLIQYHYWHKYAPTSLKDKWVFYASKPAIKNTTYQIDMFDVHLEDNDIILYPKVNITNSKIELQVYCPKLAELSDSKRYSIFFTFLDQHISELYTIKHISDINFTDQVLDDESLNINSLKQYIDTTIRKNGWPNTDDPLDAYLGYKVKESTEPNWILREDIATGYSSCTAPISAYHFKDDSFFNKYYKEGIVFGFIFYENIDITHEDTVMLRASIEDQIIEQTTHAGIADCIGGATGFHFSYIDLIIYDYDAFMKVAKDIMSNYVFEEVGFSYFLSGSKPIMLSETSL